jgi:hypothetical protein
MHPVPPPSTTILGEDNPILPASDPGTALGKRQDRRVVHRDCIGVQRVAGRPSCARPVPGDALLPQPLRHSSLTVGVLVQRRQQQSVFGSCQASRSTTTIADMMSSPTMGSASCQPAATPAAPSTTAREVKSSVRACSPSAISAAEPMRRPVRMR